MVPNVEFHIGGRSTGIAAPGLHCRACPGKRCQPGEGVSHPAKRRAGDGLPNVARPARSRMGKIEELGEEPHEAAAAEWMERAVGYPLVTAQTTLAEIEEEGSV
jgi:hypothetical protein